jgi:E3 ubiquitin-protein ligase HERC2
MDEYHRYFQIDIRQCQDGGRDCRIHGLCILGRKLIKDEEQKDEEFALIPTFLFSEEESLGRQEQQNTAARGQAGGVRRWWGRVFKKRDQEGGPKSSKTKMPGYSQVCVSPG